MKTRRTASSFAVAAILLTATAGCGSRKSTSKEQERSTEPQSSETSAPKPDNAVKSDDARPTIVTFGDSLTAGVVADTYPEELQKLLDENHLAFRVENQGVSGDTSTDGLARIDNVIAAKPVLVILEFGGNDGLRGIPVDATRKNLAEMITHLQAEKVPVVLLGITLPPNYGPDYVQPFTAMFPALAHQFHIPYIPFLLTHVYQHPELMQPDGIHPNGEGNKIVARDVFALIRPKLVSLSQAHP